MPRLPQPRAGAPLVVKGRPLPFSFFPVRRGARRYGLNDTAFAIDPWAIIEGAITDQVSGPEREESLAFVEQARAFFEAARVRTAASPLLTYYAFLNLGKAVIRCRGFSGSLDRARHGISEGASIPTSDLAAGSVTIHDSGTQANVLPELVDRLGYSRPVDGSVLAVRDLAPQIVVGHRLWREAAHRGERFVVVEPEFISDAATRQLWLRLWVLRSDLARYGITHARLVRDGGLAGAFAEVDARLLTTDPDVFCLEQTSTITYTGRPTDVVLDLVDSSRPWLWQIVTAYPEEGYRRYYLHLTGVNDANRQPQLASMWMLIFFFGSMVRYRPQAFATMTRGRYGAWINDFVAAQPDQLLFMLASEARRRVVARPAIV